MNDFEDFYYEEDCYEEKKVIEMNEMEKKANRIVNRKENEVDDELPPFLFAFFLYVLYFFFCLEFCLNELYFIYYLLFPFYQ